MIVILDHDEAILEWMDDADASIEITDTYGGYRALDFTCQLKNVKSQQYLLKQGNKLFLEGILFVINTEVEFDYVSNLIILEAEELVCEMNNCHPFYINDPLFGRYVSGNTLSISKTVISLIFQDFYTVKETDLELIDYSQKLITVNGTITRYNLLKEIESATGLMFKYEYRLDGNDIIKEVSLLKPENYGVTHDKLLERVTVGENTNKLEYNSDETKNALGIMPIIKSENNSNVDYTRILKQFYDLDINNERVMPYYNNYNFTRADILAAARTLYSKIDTYKFIPETVKISNIQNEEEITLDIGMGQFVDLATRIITNISLDTGIPLTVVECPKVTNHSGLNCVFTATDIINLARNVQDHITKSGEVNSSISTKYGLVSFQWLIYIFSEYLTTSKKVVVKSTEYPDLNKILPSTVEDKVLYIVDTDNYEYMPFMYTQNTSESKNLPFKTPMNPLPEKNMYDLNNYISESYPEMIITKEAGADNITVTITKQNISQNTPETFVLGFKDVGLIQDNSDITIDFSKKEIRFMKFFERIEEKQIEVTETVENGGTITVNMMPSCSCCGYPKTPYKRYTKTWKNYCPACGKSGTLTDNPKGVYEGEITCSMRLGGCDADYCGYCFAEGNFLLIRINKEFYRYVDIKELVEVLFNKYELIETLSVKPGTNNLEWKKITHVFNNGVQELYKISFAHNSEIIVTGDHSFYPYSRDTKKFMTKKLKAIELKKSTLLGGVRYHLSESVGEIDTLAKLIGFFLGDGTFNTRSIRFGLKKQDKIDYLIDVLSELNIHYTSSRNKIMFSRSGNEDVYDLLTKIYENDKNLDYEFITPNIARGLLSGLLSSDGYIRNVRNSKNTNGGFKSPEVVFSTINENILNIFVTSCSILGVPFFIKKEFNHGGLGKHAIYRVRLRVSSSMSLLQSLGLRHEQKIIVDKYEDYSSVYNSQIKGVPIKDIQCIGEGNVYNITVEDNHTLFIGNYSNILTANCGGDKWGNGRCEWRKLTPAEATSETTSTKTIQEVVQEYKEVTANDDATDESETKIKLSDILTTNSRMDSFHGDVSFKIEGATLKSLTCDSTKLYELAPFPYVKQAGEMFIYAPITSADFNYTHMTNDNPKLEPFETSEQSVEEVLIGCWKKLNGSGDNTAWLEKAEDINVDLSEENLELNAGDFVFIKLPDTNIFKAQIVEKKYDPKIKSDSSLKIGNVTRESIK